MESDREVLLRLDVATARLLLDALHALGEHQAAGADIPTFDAEESERLGRVIKELRTFLGKERLS